MQELEPVFDKVARYFSLLSDASRLKVIHAVCNSEQSVTDVMTATGLSQSAVSRHLTNLHLAGVASRRKIGAQALYVITDSALTDICRTACVSLMARESDELAAATALRESATQFMAQAEVDSSSIPVRPSLRAGRTEQRRANLRSGTA
jgi:DNA-binding transcriptional ArsR family regulator